MRARGFDTVQMVLAVVALGIVAGLIFAYQAHIAGLKREAYNAGRTDEKAQAIAAALARDHDVSDAIKEREAQRAAAQQRADQNDADWQRRLREARRNGTTLGSCEESGPDQGATVAAAGVAAPVAGPGIRSPGGAARAGGVRLHWAFVGLHDGAFTGLDGEPVFRDSRDFALDAARRDTPSPYGLDELLEVHGSNARALNTCLRAYGDAVGKLDAAAAAWEKRK